ncbi:hypothetical protein D187_001651 [Cystobacter fuscus DSM 2262]|uniref:Uncharacterized protein n=1 Tax=Cystobacter fuscus (strain ATCC 25194 / DSM 2262 / NBRC 100088 / M29) TaxID=1242864 RepID=S9QI83_CYSF2|nr:tetratricopeptide repeat protein [Cystobacter fuscus]EPX60999.1 hypothetical protein D187_001651 [Cystobacter fuscus DSM 2262]
MLVDHARPERLGELVRALLPISPELEVHTEAQQLVETRPGSTLVLIPRAEDADWLNINRPLFASRALRVVLFCTREVSVALSRGAVDFLDWVSLRLECPAGPPPYAVAGLRRALAARVPGIVWTGGNLEASFAVARPHRVIRKVSATRPYAELVAEIRASGPGEWLAWTDVDGDFRLRRVRWALAEARRQTRTLLVEPSVRSPGWWEVHGQVAEPGEAYERLRKAGAKQPGRLAALVDLEPEAIQLLGDLLERGVGDHSLEGAILKETDPGATVGRLASAHGLVTEKQLARGSAPPPSMRAFGAERDGMRRRHRAELETIERRLSQGERVDAEDFKWWSAWAKALPSQEWIKGIGARDEIAEILLRCSPRTEWLWSQVALRALTVQDLDVAYVWARRAVDADPEHWVLLVRVFSSRGQLAEAESLLRHQLNSTEQVHPAVRARILHELGYVLYERGHYAEAETLLRQSLAILEQSLGPRNVDYANSLHELARVLASHGRYSETEELLRQALAIQEQALGPQHPKLCATLANLGFALTLQERPQEGEPLLRRSVDIARETWGLHHPETAQALDLLAKTQAALRKPEAVTTAHQAMEALLHSLGEEHPITKNSLPGLRRIIAGGE